MVDQMVDFQYVQKVEDFPVFPEGNTSVTASSTLPPWISRTTRRTSMMTTVRASVSTARLATVRTPKVTSSTSTQLPLFSSTTTSRTSRTFPTIGKPHDCNGEEKSCLENMTEKFDVCGVIWETYNLSSIKTLPKI